MYLGAWIPRLSLNWLRKRGSNNFPLFVDYGQIARDREFEACEKSMAILGLPIPKVAAIGGYGDLIHSGLTKHHLHIVDDAFTPGRNLLFLLIAAAYACKVGADSISIGLLHEDSSLFPDQTSDFLMQAETLLTLSMGTQISVLAPLSQFHKIDVVELALLKGIENTYSCHKGLAKPCGECIACHEFKFKGDGNGRQ